MMLPDHIEPGASIARPLTPVVAVGDQIAAQFANRCLIDQGFAIDRARPSRVLREIMRADPKSWVGLRVVLSTGLNQDPYLEDAWQDAYAQIEYLRECGAEVCVLPAPPTTAGKIVNVNLKGLCEHAGVILL